MVSGLIGNEVPGNRLRVRVSCPPLKRPLFQGLFLFLASVLVASFWAVSPDMSPGSETPQIRAATSWESCWT